jgi:hypothetical protein
MDPNRENEIRALKAEVARLSAELEKHDKNTRAAGRLATLASSWLIERVALGRDLAKALRLWFAAWGASGTLPRDETADVLAACFARLVRVGSLMFFGWLAAVTLPILQLFEISRQTRAMTDELERQDVRDTHETFHRYLALEQEYQRGLRQTQSDAGAGAGAKEDQGAVLRTYQEQSVNRLVSIAEQIYVTQPCDWRETLEDVISRHRDVISKMEWGCHTFSSCQWQTLIEQATGVKLKCAGTVCPIPPGSPVVCPK